MDPVALELRGHLVVPTGREEVPSYKVISRSPSAGTRVSGQVTCLEALMG